MPHRLPRPRPAPAPHAQSPGRAAARCSTLRRLRGALRANSPEIQVLDQSNTRLIQVLAKLG
jgi:hypothetical protein